MSGLPPQAAQKQTFADIAKLDVLNVECTKCARIT
jgi:hypothetical protein